MRIRTLCCALLVLLLAISGAAATDMPQSSDPADTGFMFPNGLTWDAVVEDMCLIEGIANEQDYLLQETNGNAEYWIPYMPDANDPAGMYYIFHADQLACMGIDYGLYAEAEAQMIADELTAEYGDPVGPVDEQIVAMFNAYKAEAFPADILYTSAGWSAAGGTAIYFMNVYNESYVFYVNPDRLFAAGPAE